LFLCVLVFKNERLILECVYVKYLRSLSSHVYRFISKITKSKPHKYRRNKLGGGRAVVDKVGNCIGKSGSHVYVIKEEVQPILT
jgi:hypothetical protein